MSNSTFRIAPLGKDTWKLQIQAILIKNDAWGYVSGEFTCPEIIENDEESIFKAKQWQTGDEKLGPI